jgi:hypothetical protein
MQNRRKPAFGKYVGYISKYAFPFLHGRERGKVSDVVSIDEFKESRPYSWKMGTVKFLDIRSQISIPLFLPNRAK